MLIQEMTEYMNTTAQLIKHFEGIYIFGITDFDVVIRRMEAVEEAFTESHK